MYSINNTGSNDWAFNISNYVFLNQFYLCVFCFHLHSSNFVFVIFFVVFKKYVFFIYIFILVEAILVN